MGRESHNAIERAKHIASLTPSEAKEYLQQEKRAEPERSEGSLERVVGPLRWTATKAPRCPECNDKMEYEDDRDENGTLLNHWWHCPGCLANYGIQ